MSQALQLLDDYLRVRRALGFKLAGTEALLTQFLTYLQAHDAGTISGTRTNQHSGYSG